MSEERVISRTTAKKVLEVMFKTGKSAEEIIEENNWWLLTEKEVAVIVFKVVNENKDAVTKYLNGDSKIINVLIGKVLKEADGKAEAPLVVTLLEYMLEKERIKL